MAKIFGILMIVLLVWASVEVYTKGTAHAFGGLFSGFAATPAEAEAFTPTHERMGQKVEDSFQKAYERTEHVPE